MDRHSTRSHTPLEPANQGKYVTEQGKKIKKAYRRDTGVPDFFLEDGRKVPDEDAFGVSAGKDRPPGRSLGVFRGVDFDANGKITKE